MLRDTTFSDVSREDVLAVGAKFVMDEDAFRGFYERTSRSVWAYLSRITGDRQLADDLLQETYYRFLRASATYESESHRRNSLYKIATNLAHDARRRTRTTPMLGEVGDEVEHARGGDSPVGGDQRADLDRAMSQLKPKERAMLWLAYGEGASHKEDPGDAGLAPSSMKAILFRARREACGVVGRSRCGLDLELEGEVFAAVAEGRWPGGLGCGFARACLCVRGLLGRGGRGGSDAGQNGWRCRELRCRSGSGTGLVEGSASGLGEEAAEAAGRPDYRGSDGGLRMRDRVVGRVFRGDVGLVSGLLSSGGNPVCRRWRDVSCLLFPRC